MAQNTAPATEARAHVLKFAKTHRRALTRAMRSYPAAKDHGWTYEAGEAPDHLDPTVQEICFDALTTLDPKPTKKELQFALGMHKPIDVTNAADRHAARLGTDAHKPPLERRPGMNQAPRSKKFSADEIAAAVEAAALSDKTLARLLANLTAPKVTEEVA